MALWALTTSSTRWPSLSSSPSFVWRPSRFGPWAGYFSCFLLMIFQTISGPLFIFLLMIVCFLRIYAPWLKPDTLNHPVSGDYLDRTIRSPSKPSHSPCTSTTKANPSTCNTQTPQNSLPKTLFPDVHVPDTIKHSGRDSPTPNTDPPPSPYSGPLAESDSPLTPPATIPLSSPSHVATSPVGKQIDAEPPPRPARPTKKQTMKCKPPYNYTGNKIYCMHNSFNSCLTININRV